MRVMRGMAMLALLAGLVGCPGNQMPQEHVPTVRTDTVEPEASPEVSPGTPGGELPGADTSQ